MFRNPLAGWSVPFPVTVIATAVVVMASGVTVPDPSGLTTTEALLGSSADAAIGVGGAIGFPFWSVQFVVNGIV